MPIKLRLPKDRRPGFSRPFFSAEAVELFAKLERTPGGHLPYSDDSHRLASMLGLTNEWWASCHVNDRSSQSGYPSGHLTDMAFWKVREVRKALLALCAERAGEPKAAAASAPATEAGVSPVEPAAAPGGHDAPPAA